jgi:hypothetical protein
MSIKANLIELRQVVYLGWAFFRHTTEYFFRQCMYIAWSWLYFFFFSVALPTTYVHTYICIYLHMCSEFYRRKKCLPPFQQQRSISTAKEQILHPAWLNPRTNLHMHGSTFLFAEVQNVEKIPTHCRLFLTPSWQPPSFAGFGCPPEKLG